MQTAADLKSLNPSILPDFYSSGMNIGDFFTCCEMEVIEAAKALRLGLLGGCLKSPFLLGLRGGMASSCDLVSDLDT